MEIILANSDYVLQPSSCRIACNLISAAGTLGKQQIRLVLSDTVFSLSTGSYSEPDVRVGHLIGTSSRVLCEGRPSLSLMR